MKAKEADAVKVILWHTLSNVLQRLNSSKYFYYAINIEIYSRNVVPPQSTADKLLIVDLTEKRLLTPNYSFLINLNYVNTKLSPQQLIYACTVEMHFLSLIHAF